MSTHDPDQLPDVLSAEPRHRRVLAVALATTVVLTLGGVTAAVLSLSDRADPSDGSGAGSSEDALAVTEPVGPLVDPAEAPVEEETTDPMGGVLLAQEEVERIQGELDAALARIDEFEAREAKSAERSAQSRQRWKEMEAEVARLQVALSEAETQRDQLRAELASTLVQLDQEIARTRQVTRERDNWKQASNENLWTAFVQGAKVRLCDRGNRRAMDRCQETLAQVFDEEARGRFDQCVSARQAVPMIVELDRRAEPPAFSVALPDELRQIDKGTYVVYCDPTLPEAGAIAEAPAPEPTVLRLAAR